MSDLSIGRGFSEDERSRVAALYWAAFGTKLRTAFPDQERGLAVIEASLRPDNTLIARTPAEVRGVCGFHADGTGAIDLSWSTLRRHLGILPAVRAAGHLAFLDSGSRPATLVLDGICVDDRARGQGIGTMLLAAADDLGRSMGARAVQLSVIETNPGARRLYERVGFRPVSAGRLGLLSAVYGFDRFTVMRKDL
ncbi:GNAT family N-acetyltransferase [Microbacterium sp. BWR-S6Y]|uniref:GNAT family N-acetyltransferase n=1 Tax=Microbacterium sp. BWR-S6Y TaxID=3232073 RepID=UPI003527515E